MEKNNNQVDFSTSFDANILLDADLLIDDALEADFGTLYASGGGTSDYRKLRNKPTINGTELFDNYDEIDPTVPEWAKAESKPDYTADEINAVDRNDTFSTSEINYLVSKYFLRKN